MTAALPLAALLLAASPFEAEQPEVRAGNEALRAGDPAAALPRYDAAEREVGPHPEIDFDRGNALHAAGRPEEARAAWKKAAERAPGAAGQPRAPEHRQRARPGRRPGGGHPRPRRGAATRPRQRGRTL